MDETPVWRQLTRIGVLLAAGAVLTLAGSPAWAKGAESATVTGRAISEPVELLDGYTEHQLLRELMSRTGVWYAPLPELVDRPLGDLGPALTLTWVSIGPPGQPADERTIRQLIYLHAPGGPLIHTSRVPDGWGESVVGWFRPPAGLGDTLVELGVPPDAVARPLQRSDGNEGPQSLQLAAAAAVMATALAMTVRWARAPVPAPSPARARTREPGSRHAGP